MIALALVLRHSIENRSIIVHTNATNRNRKRKDQNFSVNYFHAQNHAGQENYRRQIKEQLTLIVFVTKGPFGSNNSSAVISLTITSNKKNSYG